MVVGASVRGAVHRRDGLPNQDAMAWTPPTESGGRLVAAVSDGHGSAKAFRSGRGARLAVTVGVDAGSAFLDRLGGAGLGALDQRAWGPLTRAIVDRWAAGVRADLAAGPISEQELADLADLDGPGARRAVEANPALAYGATLLVVAVLGSFALFLQLGDGDILVVPAAGQVTRALRDDPRLFANETTSLCMPDAAREFRVACRPLTRPGPQVLLLATDGLANAYQDETSFLQVGADLLARIGAVGIDAVAGELDAFLEEASVHSGDDVTVAAVWLSP